MFTVQFDWIVRRQSKASPAVCSRTQLCVHACCMCVSIDFKGGESANQRWKFNNTVIYISKCSLLSTAKRLMHAQSVRGARETKTKISFQTFGLIEFNWIAWIGQVFIVPLKCSSHVNLSKWISSKVKCYDSYEICTLEINESFVRDTMRAKWFRCKIHTLNVAR